MKKTIALLLALVMSLSLAACGGGSGSGSAAPSPSPATEPESSDTLTNVGDIESGAQGEAALDFGDYTPENPLTIKLATPQSNEKSHLNVLANAFKERVETWTDGAVIVDLYMGSMGSDREIVDQVIAGTLEMGVNNTAIMANYNRLFDVLDLAYLIKDYDDVYDVMASDVWADMLGEFSSTGASLLALQCIGFRTICTTENAGPVHNMSELAGKTIRITEGPRLPGRLQCLGRRARVYERQRDHARPPERHHRRCGPRARDPVHRQRPGRIHQVCGRDQPGRPLQWPGHQQQVL